MSKLEKKQMKKILLIVGLVVAIIGFVIHFNKPSVLSNSWALEDNPIFVKSGSTFTHHLDQPIGSPITNFMFYIKGAVNVDDENKCTFLLLNETEYEKYTQSVSISNLKSIKGLVVNHIPNMNLTEFEISLTIEVESDIYLVILNQNDNDVYPYYFYSIMHLDYFIGILIASLGLIFTIFVFAWYLTGWKRYFVLGAGINLTMFLIRVGSIGINEVLDTIFLIFHTGLYNDYLYFYIAWGELFIKGVWPYSAPYTSYIYGPLWILTIGVFGFLPIHAWKLAIPLFIYIIATGYLVYLTVNKITANQKYAIYSMMFYFLNPFTLMYSSFTWINPPPFVFFVLLSFYFALDDKKYLSMVSLGIAIMYKQFAVIIFPLILITIMKNSIKKGLKSRIKDISLCSLILGASIILISVPFLIVDYQSYLNKLLLGHTVTYSIEFLTFFYYFDISRPVTFNSFFLLIQSPEIITTTIAYLLSYWVLLSAALGAIYIYHLVKTPSRKIIPENDDKDYTPIIEGLFLTIIIVLCFQLFYPRGSYKFYLILLVPFISIFFDSKNFSLKQIPDESQFKFKKRFLFSYIFSWFIFICNRYVYFLFLIVWIIYYILAKRKENKTKIDIEQNP
jgi:hypothetical protein